MFEHFGLAGWIELELEVVVMKAVQAKQGAKAERAGVRGSPVFV